MQKTTWTAEQIDAEFGDLGSLSEVIKVIEGYFWRRGEVICDIRVNGMFMDGKDEIRFASEKVENLESIEVKSQRPLDLLAETLRSVSEYLPRVRESAIIVAERFQQGSNEEAHRLCLKVLDSCRWLSDWLFLVKKSCGNWADVKVSEDLWRRAELTFTNVLRDLCSAYENKDFVALADILEYELSNSLEQWLELVGLLGMSFGATMSNPEGLGNSSGSSHMNSSTDLAMNLK
ncbi:MAG: hypothetical protein IPK68_16795 [Bdellovibrionales bacterium]|nr:hypothetical protein [Bdellovibrionales bacterium]